MKMSSSVSATLPRVVPYQMATHLPCPSVVICGSASLPMSVAALAFNAAGGVHVTPPSVDLAVRMSSSVPMVPPRESVDVQTATQFPLPSVASRGL